MSVWLSPVAAGAQTVHPNVVVFVPSAHHRAIGTNAQPLVRNYALEIYRRGEPNPALVLDLGKPDPSADGYIQVHIDHLIAGALPAELLEARVTALGPDGAARSPLSNLFAFSRCRLLIPGSLSMAASGGPVAVVVQVPDGCAWKAQPRDAWLSVDTDAVHAGADTLQVTATPNRTTQPRLGSVAVGPQLLLVFQAAATAPLTVNPASSVAPALTRPDQQ